MQGPQIDFAAPGVNVWTAASIRGARPKTGTSFAAPFVTAAVALLRAQHPDPPPGRLRELLSERSRDLGPPACDPIFGEGLVSFDDLCAPAL